MYRYFIKYKGRTGCLCYRNKQIPDHHLSDMPINNLAELEWAVGTKYEKCYRKAVDRFSIWKLLK